MSPSESESASGKLRLFREWKESASSHRETLKTADLVGQGDYVVLEMHYEESNIYKIKDDIDKTTRYRVNVNELIQYVKEQGEVLKD